MAKSSSSRTSLRSLCSPLVTVNRQYWAVTGANQPLTRVYSAHCAGATCS